MLHPTIDELTQGKYNRYELALATAKCARIVTSEYMKQHDAAERAITGNKETDRPLHTMIDRELRDEKAVKVAIARLYAGEYAIDLGDLGAPINEQETAEATETATPAEAAEQTEQTEQTEAVADEENAEKG